MRQTTFFVVIFSSLPSLKVTLKGAESILIRHTGFPIPLCILLGTNREDIRKHGQSVRREQVVTPLPFVIPEPARRDFGFWS
jgi:hypothetical protein